VNGKVQLRLLPCLHLPCRVNWWAESSGQHNEFVVKTTIADHERVLPPDLVQRVFDQRRLNAARASDMTYRHCGAKVAYLCVTRDEHSGRVMGYAVADNLRDELVINALKMTFTTRANNTESVIFHTNRGAQFNSRNMINQCNTMGLQ
jgi:putative transposase